MPQRRQPFKSTGMHGVEENVHRLGVEFDHMPRKRLREMQARLLREGRIVKTATGSEKGAGWLDVQGGQFAQGVGEFMPGYVKSKEPTPPIEGG